MSLTLREFECAMLGATLACSEGINAYNAGMRSEYTLPYQPYYCEENIWHLCASPLFEGKEKCVLILTNPDKAFAIFFSRSAAKPESFILWDYHVIFAVKDKEWTIWDPDTRLGIPVPAQHYLKYSFPGLKKPFQPQFRVLEADVYHETLSSDRSHMLDQDGNWNAPPPSWEPIQNGPNNLMDLIDLKRTDWGTIMNLEEVGRFLNQ